MAVTTRRASRSFWKSGREDSPFKRILIHLALILACMIAVYPVLRIFTVSIRPGDKIRFLVDDAAADWSGEST